MTKLYKVKHNCKEKADIKTPTTEYGDVMSSCVCVRAQIETIEDPDNILLQCLLYPHSLPSSFSLALVHVALQAYGDYVFLHFDAEKQGQVFHTSMP